MFVVADKYRVLAPLAEGGMGAVYSAVHIATGRNVALKILHGDRAADTQVRGRFMREARIARGLVSPHIAKVLDAGTDATSGLPYIAMELLEGQDLMTLIRRRSHLPVGLALVIAAHVAAGLAEAHEADIVHRDIKPANVVLSTNAEGKLIAKLIDFGIARAEDQDEEVKTRTGDFMGSLPYMSPEQLSGERVDARTDVWSLGVLMYEALSGLRPTGNESAVAVIVHKVCRETIPPLTEIARSVPPEVSALVQRAMSRARDERFSSAREMHDAIVALLVDGVHYDAGVVETGEEINVRASPALLEDDDDDDDDDDDTTAAIDHAPRPQLPTVDPVATTAALTLEVGEETVPLQSAPPPSPPSPPPPPPLPLPPVIYSSAQPTVPPNKPSRSSSSSSPSTAIGIFVGVGIAAMIALVGAAVWLGKEDSGPATTMSSIPSAESAPAPAVVPPNIAMSAATSSSSLSTAAPPTSASSRPVWRGPAKTTKPKGPLEHM